MYFNSTINSQLKEILNGFKEMYRYQCEESRLAHIATLKSWDRVPTDEKLYTQEARQTVQDGALEARQKARAILSNVINELKAKTTVAPSEDAVRTITLLNMRKIVSEEEIRNLLDRYGDNDQARRAIRDIAEQHDIYIGPGAGAAEKLEEVEYLAHTLDKTLSYLNVAGGHASNGYFAVIEMQIDQVFPAD